MKDSHMIDMDGNGSSTGTRFVFGRAWLTATARHAKKPPCTTVRASAPDLTIIQELKKTCRQTIEVRHG